MSTRLTRRKLAVILGAAAVVLAGCAQEQPGDSGSKDLPAGSVPDLALPRSDEPVALDPAELSPRVTHRYWPMAPGTRWTYRETNGEGVELRVVVTATSATKTLANGVTARVVRDTVTADGELVEDTFDWYAQDASGTVWYLGEDTAEFEGGELSSHAGSFEAGVDGALPGVMLPAEPMVGMEYRQEYLEGVAEDNGEILALDASVRVAAGSYRDCLQTADTNALEPDVLEHKFYALGVGPVLAVDVNGGDREELVSIERVSDAEAARAGKAPLGESY